MTRRATIVTNRQVDRQLWTTVSPAVHDAFDAAARARNTNRGPLLRQIVEAVGRKPQLLDAVIGKPQK